MSTFAVEKRAASIHMPVRERNGSRSKGQTMRIVEMAMIGFVAVAAQFLVVGALLI
jgi:hypothetical protein